MEFGVLTTVPRWGELLVSAFDSQDQSARTFDEAGRLITRLSEGRPSVAIIDQRVAAAPEAIRSIVSLFPRVAILYLVADVKPTLFRTAISWGNCVVGPLTLPPSDIVDNAVALASGNAMIPLKTLRELTVGTAAPNPPPPLGAHDLAILRRIAEGAPVTSLAAAEWVSRRQMHRRLRKLYERLGATNRSQAIITATQLGLVQDRSETSEGRSESGTA